MANIKCPRCRLLFKTNEEFKATTHFCTKILFPTSTYELITALYNTKFLN